MGDEDSAGAGSRPRSRRPWRRTTTGWRRSPTFCWSPPTFPWTRGAPTARAGAGAPRPTGATTPAAWRSSPSAASATRPGSARPRPHPDRHPVNPRRERFALRWDDPDPQPPWQRPTNPVHRPTRPRGNETPRRAICCKDRRSPTGVSSRKSGRGARSGPGFAAGVRAPGRARRPALPVPRTQVSPPASRARVVVLAACATRPIAKPALRRACTEQHQACVPQGQDKTGPERHKPPRSTPARHKPNTPMGRRHSRPIHPWAGGTQGQVPCQTRLVRRG